VSETNPSKFIEMLGFTSFTPAYMPEKQTKSFSSFKILEILFFTHEAIPNGRRLEPKSNDSINSNDFAFSKLIQIKLISISLTQSPSAPSRLCENNNPNSLRALGALRG
jgi:hypothetical protein